jgi:hypothetical protein
MVGCCIGGAIESSSESKTMSLLVLGFLLLAVKDVVGHTSKDSSWLGVGDEGVLRFRLDVTRSGDVSTVIDGELEKGWLGKAESTASVPLSASQLMLLAGSISTTPLSWEANLVAGGGQGLSGTTGTDFARRLATDRRTDEGGTRSSISGYSSS